MNAPDFEPRDIDASRPSAARLYHYYLSGEAVFGVDKIFAEHLFQLFPYADAWAHHNRKFLRRAVRFMVAHGIRQFLDIGSGLPTVGNTHEIARLGAPDARVVYVDNDLEAVNRSDELLRHQGVTDTVAVIEADLRDPDFILDHPDTGRLIDFGAPLGLLIVSVWPFIPDSDHPADLMARLRGRLPAGSFVAMSHASMSEVGDDLTRLAAEISEMYTDTSDPLTMRDRDDIAALFDGLTLVEPGLVYAADWRPDEPVDPSDPARPGNFAAVGYKP
ncbi:SAM-dependent methyltransferase [Nocardia sp. NPDC051570]|uniref:SAM-dependent methyltransferase n=1 Tax=Nocardia sp. NPDC051570 TaxID=3364324 RepID=UPI0037AED688